MFSTIIYLTNVSPIFVELSVYSPKFLFTVQNHSKNHTHINTFLSDHYEISLNLHGKF